MSDDYLSTIKEMRSLYEAKFHVPQWHRDDYSLGKREQEELDTRLVIESIGHEMTIALFLEWLASIRLGGTRWLWAFNKFSVNRSTGGTPSAEEPIDELMKRWGKEGKL